MARKGKKIVWHKKSGKLISSKFAAARGKRGQATFSKSEDGTGNKVACPLFLKIRQAVKDAHK